MSEPIEVARIKTGADTTDFWPAACQGAYAILRDVLWREEDEDAEITPVAFHEDDYRTYLHLTDGRRYYVAIDANRNEEEEA